MINKSLYLATWLTKPCFEYFMKLHLFTHPLVGGRSTGVLKSRNFILTCLYDNVTGFKFLHCPVWTLLLSLHRLIYVHRRMFSNAESAKFKTRTFPALNFPRLSQFFIGVRSLATFCQWLTNSLTHKLLFSRLDWCDPDEWRCQLKPYWGCYCCRCWCWQTCWQQFVAVLGAEVWS